MSDKKQTKYIAVLDIGASKVIAVIAEVVKDGEIKILGIGHQLSQGIGRNAVISELRSLEYCLINALSAAEKAAGIDIEEVFVNITGNKLHSSLQIVEADISKGELKERDLEQLCKETYTRFRNQDLDVIQSIAVNYSIDGIDGITNPCYMTGKTLRAYFNVVRVSSSAKNNYANCLARCHLNINSFVPSGFVAAEAILTEDEKHAGAIIMDIGKNMTDIAIYYDGKPHFVSSLPIGGGVITSDIKQIFALSEKNAERLKVIYGSVFPDHKHEEIDLFDVIEGQDFDHSDYISKHKLTDIIYERAAEIFGYFYKYFSENKDVKYHFQKAWGNVIITGGMANLVGVEQLAETLFSGKVRIGHLPKQIIFPEEHQDPSNAVIYGLLKIAAKSKSKKDSTFSKKLLDDFKNFLQELKK